MKTRHYHRLLFLILLCGQSWADSDLMDRALPDHQNPETWNRFTVEQLSRDVPKPTSRFDAKVWPARRFNALPSGIYFDLQSLWIKNGLGDDPEVIFITSGSVYIEDLYRSLGRSEWIEKTGKHQYLIKRPVYIGPGATLVIDGKSVLLSLRYGAFIAYNGSLYLQNGGLSAWDTHRGDFGSRSHLDIAQVFLSARHELRPFVVGLRGSYTHLVGSEIRALGYIGAPSVFGISISAAKASASRVFGNTGYIAQLPMPTGIIIGNTIQDLMFGFFTNHAKDVVLIGNLIKDSVVYNVDPHDYTTGMVIARNVTARAKIKHGIIISRGVDDTVIAENISLNNAGAGIMLDRGSKWASISGNLVLDNDGDGISVLESPDAELRLNRVSRNLRNGIFVRNSAGLKIAENHLIRNGKNGAELKVLDIALTHKSRDFDLDPFAMSTEADLTRNHIDENFRAAVSSKGGAIIKLRDNVIGSQNAQMFGGEMLDQAAGWLQMNKAGKPSP